MRPKPMNTALDIQREASHLPDVAVVYTNASAMLSGEHNDDKIELDMRDASEGSQSIVRELANNGWEIEDHGRYWTLTSDYYPRTAEEMLPDDPTENATS